MKLAFFIIALFCAFAEGLELHSYSHSKDISADFESLISSNQVMVFSKSTCPACIEAKKLLDALNIKYTAFDSDLNTSGNQMLSFVSTKTAKYTVPQIFFNR